jgi:hypothetical protein
MKESTGMLPEGQDGKFLQSFWWLPRDTFFSARGMTSRFCGLTVCHITQVKSIGRMQNDGKSWSSVVKHGPPIPKQEIKRSSLLMGPICKVGHCWWLPWWIVIAVISNRAFVFCTTWL